MQGNTKRESPTERNKRHEHIQPQHGRRQQHTRAAATAAATAAADVVPAGRPRQRRRRGRRASVGVVDDVARLQTAGATSRRCLERDGNARHDTVAS